MSVHPVRFVVDSDSLLQFVSDVFEATGMEQDHATVFAENLVDANLRGKESHGLIRLSHYVRRIQSGGMNVSPVVTTERVAPSVARADGDGGPGQVVSTLAVEKAMELASKQGVGVVGVTDSNHFGTVSYYTNQMATEGYIGIGMTHGGPILAPYGAAEAYFSTNPIAIAAPHQPYPVSLDISTSATALGNILIAEENDEEIPQQWALDENGEPTTDPAAFDALRPMAGHKGSGLALVVDVLCGALLSGRVGSDVSGLYDDIGSQQELGHLFFCIDVDAFVPADVFEERVSTLVAGLKDLPVRDGAEVDEVHVPGERSHHRKQERLDSGVPIRDPVWTELKELATEFDLQLPEHRPDNS